MGMQIIAFRVVLLWKDKKPSNTESYQHFMDTKLYFNWQSVLIFINISYWVCYFIVKDLFYISIGPESFKKKGEGGGGGRGGGIHLSF